MAGTKKEVAKKAANKTGKVAKTVTGSDDGKALFFLILASSCLYLILDVFYGNNKLLSLAQNIFGVSSGSSDSSVRSSIKSNLPTDDAGEAYKKVSKSMRETLDETYESWLAQGYDNLPDWQKKEIDAWKKAKAELNADDTGGGSK